MALPRIRTSQAPVNDGSLLPCPYDATDAADLRRPHVEMNQ
jgi:hypothetical protein